MSAFTKITPQELTENPFTLIGKEWALVTAGTPERFNTMTVSWGGVGVLWNKPVTFTFIRPQRYTFEFLEEEKDFTLTVLPEQYRNALMVCGRKSGRDCDKVAEAGLTAIETESGNMTFAEGKLVMECKKIYGKFFDPKEFLDTEIITKNFPNNDFHKVYIAEIEKVWAKD